MEKTTKGIGKEFVLGLITSALLMSIASRVGSGKKVGVLFKFKGKLKIRRKRKRS